MKQFSKIAVMTICLIITALFTSACGGGGGKATPPSYPYFPINNQQANNNEQQENNNEEQVASTDITLTLTDSLQADKIAKADIFYKIETTTKATNEDDKEMLQVAPTADDNTKFTITIVGTSNPANIKIKAIITYDNDGNILDTISSYDGISGNNNEFAVNFGNSKDNKEGFGGGSGTPEDPYIISAPRHFVNINKQDDEGNYLYLDKSFKQTENIDFSHLTGLKINKTENQKATTDISIDKKNEKAPYYNDGHGIIPIGKYNPEASAIADERKYAFKGNYDGDNHIIDGIIMVNPQHYVGLFSLTYNSTIQNLTIGENSIFFIDEIDDSPWIDGSMVGGGIFVGTISGTIENSTIDNCENRAEIFISNIEANYAYNYTVQVNGIAGYKQTEADYFYAIQVNEIAGYKQTGDIYTRDIYIGETPNNIIKNCKNTGNISIDKCSFGSDGGAHINIGNNQYNQSTTNNTNEGNINITNNKSKSMSILNITNKENNYTNKGHITVDSNTNLNIRISNNKLFDNSQLFYDNFFVLESNGHTIPQMIIPFTPISMENCTNDEGDIIITNNNCVINNYKGSISVNNFEASSFSNCVNSGNIVINGNTNYEIQFAKNVIGPNITGCKNTGTVTIDGVVGEIYNPYLIVELIEVDNG